MLQIISLAQYAAVYSRNWAVDSLNGRVRLKAENDGLLQGTSLEREASRIKDARMARIPALTEIELPDGGERGAQESMDQYIGSRNDRAIPATGEVVAHPPGQHAPRGLDR